MQRTCFEDGRLIRNQLPNPLLLPGRRRTSVLWAPPDFPAIDQAAMIRLLPFAASNR